MLFNSFHFFLFFPIVTTLYFLLPHRCRLHFLLAASCYFYMAFIPAYILILLVLIGVDYSAGILIENAAAESGAPRARLILALSLGANIGFLAFFKYFNFLNTNLAAVLSWMHLPDAIPYTNIILPIGLSFHTFQSMAYTIEVYRGRQGAERNLLVYALYVLFYPQMVAGPIERPQTLIRQFYQRHEFDYERVVGGLKLMAWGLFKKAVIADRLAGFVNSVYSHPNDCTGLPLLAATYFFAFQIYCDFSGYSDIAIGAAQVMGFRLIDNFDRPYSATSVSDFWNRWHISLSSWFRDYLYIPLGGSRTAVPRWYLNLLVVFLVSGLWHGANWTFVIWGALHGCYLVGSLLTRGLRSKIIRTLRLEAQPLLYRVLCILVTFHLVTFAWIFFRANSVADAFYIASHLCSNLAPQVIQSLPFSPCSKALSGQWLLSWPNCRLDMMIALPAILIMLLVEGRTSLIGMRNLFSQKILVWRWTAYYALAIALLFLGKYEAREFIYFKF